MLITSVIYLCIYVRRLPKCFHHCKGRCLHLCGFCKKDFRCCVTTVCKVHFNTSHFAQQQDKITFLSISESHCSDQRPTIECLKLFMKWCQCDLFYTMQFSFCFLKGFYMDVCREIYSVVVRCDQMCTLKLIVGNKD